MENASIKPAEAGLIPQQGKASGENGAPPGGLAVTFADLLQKAGIRADNGLEAVIDSIRGSESSERARELAAVDDRDQFRDQPDRDFDTRRDVAGDADDRPERQDDFGRRQSTEHGDERRDTYSDVRDEDHPGDHASNKQNIANDDHAAQGHRDDDQPDGVAQSTADGEPATDPQTAANGESAAGDGQPASVAAETLAPQAGMGTQHAEQVLAGLLAGIQSNTLPGAASDNANTRTGTVAQRENAIEGLTSAVAAVGGTNSAAGANAGRTDSHANGAGNNANTNANANANAQAATETAGNAGGGVSRQAAELSKMIGSGERVQINVTVDDEAKTLVSRPSAALATATASRGPGHSSAAAGPAGTQTPVTLSASEFAASQIQQTAAQMAQAQGAASGALEAKSSAAGPAITTSINHGGPAAAGGSAATTPIGLVTTAETFQAAQAATRAANAPRMAAASQPVVQQVTVQINRAIEAGMDKINIQLKPASMGRIDVQLEINHDGRVMAVVTADNKDTMDLLQRDARELARALQEAGLEANASDLSFSLRGQDGQDGNSRDDTAMSPGANDAPVADLTEGDAMDALLAMGAEIGIRADGRIDIRA